MKSLFYRPLRINESDHDICFWSDTHFNHRCEHWKVPLWRSRGFSSVEEHNETLIQRWNDVSSTSSTFFHLGDFVFGYNSITTFKNIIQKVQFKDLYVMPGNHNSGWKQVFEEQRGNVWYVSSTKRVFFVPNYLEVQIEEQLVVLSHFPILSFNGQTNGSFCLYGHVHGNLAQNDIGKIYCSAKTKEVTVEAAPFPITFNEIKRTMRDRTVVTFEQPSVSEFLS